MKFLQFPGYSVWLKKSLFGDGQGASSPRPQRTKNKTCGFLGMAQETSVVGAMPQLMLCGKEMGLGGRRYGLRPNSPLFLIGLPQWQLPASNTEGPKSWSHLHLCFSHTSSPLANGPQFQNKPRAWLCLLLPADLDLSN